MDDYSRHEVVDRLALLSDAFSRYVEAHDWVEALDEDDELRLVVEAAGEAIWAAYQAVAGDHLEE